MVKSSHSNKNHGHVGSPRPGSSPTPKAPTDSSKTPRSRQASGRVRQSLRLTSLRDNYSQLLDEFTEWSAVSQAQKQQRLSETDDAITPQASAANSSSKAKQRRSSRPSDTDHHITSAVRLDTKQPGPQISPRQSAGQDTAPQPRDRQPAKQLQQDGASNAAAVNPVSAVNSQLRTPPKSRSDDLAQPRSSRSAGAAASMRSSKRSDESAAASPASTASAQKPKFRRKTKPRPAWRSSIDFNSIQQKQQQDEGMQDAAAQNTADDTVVLRQPVVAAASFSSAAEQHAESAEQSQLHSQGYRIAAKEEEGQRRYAPQQQSLEQHKPLERQQQPQRRSPPLQRDENQQQQHQEQHDQQQLPQPLPQQQLKQPQWPKQLQLLSDHQQPALEQQRTVEKQQNPAVEGSNSAVAQQLQQEAPKHDVAAPAVETQIQKDLHHAPVQHEQHIRKSQPASAVESVLKAVKRVVLGRRSSKQLRAEGSQSSDVGGTASPTEINSPLASPAAVVQAVQLTQQTGMPPRPPVAAAPAQQGGLAPSQVTAGESRVQQSSNRMADAALGPVAGSSLLQQQEQALPRRQRESESSSAAAGASSSTAGVPAARVPMLPLKQLQPSEPLAAAAPVPSIASGSLAPGAARSASSSSNYANRQHSTPAELAASSNSTAAARAGSVDTPDLLPGGVTYRRHSAANAEQESLEATLSPAGAASLQQIGLAVAAGLGSSAANVGVSSADPLQHIKQLQAQRRRSIGPQVNESTATFDSIAAAANSLGAAAGAASANSSNIAGSPLPPLLGPPQPPHHRRSSSQGSSVTSSRSASMQQPQTQRSSSIRTPRDAGVVGSAGSSALPELKPSWASSRRSSSSQLPPLDEAAVSVYAAAPVVPGQPLLPPIGSRRGSRADDDASSSSKGYRISKDSSGTAVVPPSLPSSNSGGKAHVVIESTGNSSSGGGSNRHGLENVEISYGLDGPVDSRISIHNEDSSAGPGLGYELSSYGVCGDDPAGAVQLLRANIPGKLARLKGRISNRNITIDDDGQPIGLAAAAPAGAFAAAVSDPGGSGSGGVMPQRLVVHHGHSRSTGPMDSGSNHEHASVERPPKAALHTRSEHTLSIQQQQQAGPAGRTRARWQIPDQPDSEQLVTAQQQQQQQLPYSMAQQQQQPLQMGPPSPQQQQQQLVPQVPQQAQQPPPRWPPLQQQPLPEPWQQHVYGQQHTMVAAPSSRPLPSRSASLKQPTHWDEHHAAQQQYGQQGRLRGSHSFHYPNQQQHWQPQPPLPQQHWGEPYGQMQGRLQQVPPPPMQHWGQPPPWVAWQQQQPPVQVPPSSNAPGMLPPLNYVPPPPSMQQYPPQIPNIDGRRQQMEPLPAYYPQTASGPIAVNPRPPPGPGGGSSAASATAAALSALSATAAAMAGPGGFVAPVPPSGALSRFTDPWAEKQQQQAQQQQAHQEQQQQQQSPAVHSAAAMARQRQQEQQVAFEGMSLEAVLKTAKKPKPPSIGKPRHSAPDTETAAT